MPNHKIVEVQIRKISQLSDAAKREVESKLEVEPDTFNFKGYAKVSYVEYPPMRVVSVDPIEGTVNDYFKSLVEQFNRR
jgi:hypothetical protein